MKSKSGRPRGKTNRETLRTTVYREIRRRLIAGKFAPGEPMTIRSLAEKLHAGSMPVREAVQQLAIEGALVMLPNRSIKVLELSAKEFEELHEIRVLLEGQAAYKAALHITSAEIDSLAANLSNVEDTLKNASPAKALEANMHFHFEIYRCAQSAHLLSMIEALWLRVGPLLIYPYQSRSAEREQFFKAMELHYALVDALKARSPKQAQKCLQKIIQSSAKWYQRYYRGWA